MKFYDNNGRSYEYFAASLAARMKEKITNRLSRNNEEDDTKMDNSEKRCNAPVEETEETSEEESKEERNEFKFGSIEIDWGSRVLNLVDDKGVIRQSTPISEGVIPILGDIDVTAIPDPNTKVDINTVRIVDKYMDNMDICNIVNHMNSVNIDRDKDSAEPVIHGIVNMINNISTKSMDYNPKFPGNSSAGFIEFITDMISKRIKHADEFI